MKTKTTKSPKTETPATIRPTEAQTLFRVSAICRHAAQAVKALAQAHQRTDAALAAHMAEIDAAVGAYWTAHNHAAK